MWGAQMASRGSARVLRPKTVVFREDSQESESAESETGELGSPYVPVPGEEEPAPGDDDLVVMGAEEDAEEDVDEDDEEEPRRQSTRKSKRRKARKGAKSGGARHQGKGKGKGKAKRGQGKITVPPDVWWGCPFLGRVAAVGVRQQRRRRGAPPPPPPPHLVALPGRTLVGVLRHRR